MDIWKLFSANSDAILTALLSCLVLIYAGIFRGLGSFLSRFTTPIAMGYWFYWRSNNPNKINVTLNIIDCNKLDIDTIVADRLLTDIYKNHFIAQVVKQAAKRTTVENPIIHFHHEPFRRPWLKLPQKSEKHLYEAVYNPLISEVSEKTNNVFSFMKSIGLAMREFRFVLALTYEKGIPGRDQHFRCMMIWENALLELPAECPSVDHSQYYTRFNTLQIIAKEYRDAPHHFGIVKLWLPEIWVLDVGKGVNAGQLARHPLT